MTAIAVALIEEMELLGIDISADQGDMVLSCRPPAELRELLIRHKVGVLRELFRHQAIQMLKADVGLERAYIVDDSDPERVLIMTTIRGIGTCGIEVERASWCPMLFLSFMESANDRR